MPQELIRDEMIRLHGWDVFRSTSRDHMVPLTNDGRRVAKFRVNQAAPAEGVSEGVVLSPEEQEARNQARAAAMREAGRSGTDRPLGVSRYLFYNLRTVTGNPDPVDAGEEILPVGIAPFDGFVTEAFLELTSGATVQQIAFRTTSGQTMFRSTDGEDSVVGFLNAEPDFITPARLLNSANQVTLRNLKMPVYSGEQIFAVVRLNSLFPPNTNVGAGILGFEGFVLAKQGSAAAESQFLALNTAAINAARDASNNETRLRIEREKTRRAEIEAKARTDVARIASENRRPAGVPMNNPFNQVLLTDGAQSALARRQPVQVPQPSFGQESGGGQIGGKGQTFVSSWMPQQGAVGYTIPDPPPGGRVNVFGDTYTVWDSMGKMVSQGKVQTVSDPNQLADGTRISRNLGVKPSQAIRDDQAAIINTRAGGSAFG